MSLHDTYARRGRDTFPGIPFLAPEGLNKVVNFATQPLLPAPAEWFRELQVFAVSGVPRLKEHLFLYIPTRTLIVADLLFNFAPDEKGWDHFFHRYLLASRGILGSVDFFDFAFEIARHSARR
jgi:hypothetical protein